MGVIARLSELIVANVNVLLDRAENPEIMLSQLVRDTEDGLQQARRYAATVIANQRSMERERDSHLIQATWWKEKARQALQTGHEDLARRAISRKQEHDESYREQEPVCVEAARSSDAVRSALIALEARLAGLRRKQRDLITRHRAAKARAIASRFLGSRFVSSSRWHVRFERLEDRLITLTDELEAEASLVDPLLSFEVELKDQERERLIARDLDALKSEPPLAPSSPDAGVS